MKKLLLFSTLIAPCSGKKNECFTFYWTKWVLTLLIVCFSLSLFSQGIDFEYNLTYKEAQEKAIKTGKIIFVDVYATWCGPCKWMDRTVFTDTELGELVNPFCIPIKIDAEREGIKFAKDFDITGYPTLLFLHPDGTVLHRVYGAADKYGFMKEIDEALVQTELGAVYIPLNQQWRNGTHSVHLANSYFKFRELLKLPNKMLFEQLIKKLPKDSLDVPEMYQLSFRTVKEIEGAGFEYLAARKHIPKLELALWRNIGEHQQQAIQTQNKKHLSKVIKAIHKVEITTEVGELQETLARLAYETGGKDFKKFHEIASDYVPKVLLPFLNKSNRETPSYQLLQSGLTSIIWMYSTYISDKEALKQAASWLDQVIYPTEELTVYHKVIREKASAK